MRLRNKLAIITAAASGMGKAGVELFLKEGARVAAIDINEAALRNMTGANLYTIRADLSNPDEARQAI